MNSCVELDLKCWSSLLFCPRVPLERSSTPRHRGNALKPCHYGTRFFWRIRPWFCEFSASANWSTFQWVCASSQHTGVKTLARPAIDLRNSQVSITIVSFYFCATKHRFYWRWRSARDPHPPPSSLCNGLQQFTVRWYSTFTENGNETCRWSSVSSSFLFNLISHSTQVYYFTSLWMWMSLIQFIYLLILQCTFYVLRKRKLYGTARILVDRSRFSWANIFHRKSFFTWCNCNCICRVSMEFKTFKMWPTQFRMH